MASPVLRLFGGESVNPLVPRCNRRRREPGESHRYGSRRDQNDSDGLFVDSPRGQH